jgi:hypothetical protein
VEAGPGWLDAALEALADLPVAAVAPLVCRGDVVPRVVSAGVAWGRGGVLARLGEGSTVDAVAGPQRRLAAPDALAGVYRRSALEALGGFDARLGREAATVDLALRLRQAGFRVAAEPRSRLHARPTAVPNGRALRRGRDREILFWRWSAARGRLGAVLAHGAMLAGQAVAAIARPSLLLELLGRIVGVLELVVGGVKPEPLESPPAPLRKPPRRPHFLDAASRPAAPAGGAEDSAPGGYLPPATATGCPASNSSGCSSSSKICGPCSSGPAAPRRLPG